MNFPPENQNYVTQYRNMLQQQQLQMAANGYPHHSHPVTGSNGGGMLPDASAFGRSSLAKLISSSTGGSNNVPSVIQSAPSHHHLHRSGVFSPAEMIPEKLSATIRQHDDGSNGFDDGGGVVDRRDSTGTNSNVSPGSVASSGGPGNEDDCQLDAMVVHRSRKGSSSNHALSPVPEGPTDDRRQHYHTDDDDRMMSMSPKSEVMSDSMDDGDRDGEEEAAIAYKNNMLHQQLLHRKGSILQYCLTNPHTGAGAGGGSDAEAEHTSNSPGSSRSEAGGLLGEDACPGQMLQCEFCDFSNPSRFHFNSHMNTHCVHRCPVPECNYSTRTEGRLRRHVKNHHDPSGLKDDNDVDMMSDEKPRGKKTSDAGSAGASNSTSKLKYYRCKQCPDFLATNKNDNYDHSRLHIKPEKLLECPVERCRFVTEYKHHLEYHVRNHSGSKPFKCPNSNCNYTCVNKSMLNSHMKSHSSYYQHRCECGYVTKYTHSLKLHLNKYKHKAMNNGPESAQISMADSPQTPPAFHQNDDSSLPPVKVSAEKPVKRRRNVNKINIQHQQQLQQQQLLEQQREQQRQQQQQQQPSHPHPNMGFSPYQMPPGAAMTEGGQMVMTGGFPFGMYGGVGGPMSQFHAASIYNNLLLSAAANGMMPGMPGMNRFVRRPESPERNLKRESPSPAASEPQQDQPQDFSRDHTTRNKQNGGVLRMLPQSQSRIIRSISEINGTNGVAAATASSSVTAPLDLSGGKENGAERQSESPKSDHSSSTNGNGPADQVSSSSRRRRKGPAFKIDLAVRQRLQDSVVDDEEPDQPDVTSTNDSEGEAAFQVVQPESPPDAFVHHVKGQPQQNGTTTTLAKSQPPASTVILPVNGTGPKREHRRELLCSYCSMTFEDRTMYHMHMGFHNSQDDPFTCKCGHEAGDKCALHGPGHSVWTTWSFGLGDLIIRSGRPGHSVWVTWSLGLDDLIIRSERPGHSVWATWSFGLDDLIIRLGDLVIRSERPGHSVWATWSFGLGDLIIRSGRPGHSVWATWSFGLGDLVIRSGRPGHSVWATWSLGLGDLIIRSGRPGHSVWMTWSFGLDDLIIRSERGDRMTRTRMRRVVLQPCMTTENES
ncbi:putative Protein hunchback [Hypsibius exemplaris]|uniref:C2H2-type domain-containing protein n=1 Tax=Hypsibius exemplaris TaxID=2072580 RepID=A0A1W0X0Y1_HYPEX|nr:putative Protein hunchback [Hypsibius exemplaris]